MNIHFLNNDTNIEIGFRLIPVPVSTTAVCSTMTKRDSIVLSNVGVYLAANYTAKMNSSGDH